MTRFGLQRQRKLWLIDSARARKIYVPEFQEQIPLCNYCVKRPTRSYYSQVLIFLDGRKLNLSLAITKFGYVCTLSANFVFCLYDYLLNLLKLFLFLFDSKVKEHDVKIVLKMLVSDVMPLTIGKWWHYLVLIALLMEHMEKISKPKNKYFMRKWQISSPANQKTTNIINVFRIHGYHWVNEMDSPNQVSILISTILLSFTHHQQSKRGN